MEYVDNHFVFIMAAFTVTAVIAAVALVITINDRNRK